MHRILNSFIQQETDSVPECSRARFVRRNRDRARCGSQSTVGVRIRSRATKRSAARMSRAGERSIVTVGPVRRCFRPMFLWGSIANAMQGEPRTDTREDCFGASWVATTTMGISLSIGLHALAVHLKSCSEGWPFTLRAVAAYRNAERATGGTG
jgi:hypothetical protein